MSLKTEVENNLQAPPPATPAARASSVEWETAQRDFPFETGWFQPPAQSGSRH
jgi:hypothetical protein